MANTLQCSPSNGAGPHLVRLDLRGAEQTVLGPLHARAVDATRPLSLLRDRRSAEIAARLELDYSEMRPPAITAVLRTRLFDTMTMSFLSDHPHATVVDVGAGLNTRFERLDNGTLRWFDIDRPRVAALRRRLLPVSGRRMHVATSILDARWLDLVATTSGPHCFLFEAVLGYVPCAAVRPLLARIAARFTAAMIVFDLHPRWIVDRAGELTMAGTLDAPAPCAQTVRTAIEQWSIGARVIDVVALLGYSSRDSASTSGRPRMIVELQIA